MSLLITVGITTIPAIGRILLVKKKVNGVGLYDMTGNVWEWMSDWYAEAYYADSPKDAPQGPSSGTTHTLRGGYWGDLARFVRVARRINLAPAARAAGDGFRVAVSVSDAPGNAR